MGVRVTLSGIWRSSSLKKKGPQEASKAADFQRPQLSPGWPLLLDQAARLLLSLVLLFGNGASRAFPGCSPGSPQHHQAPAGAGVWGVHGTKQTFLCWTSNQVSSHPLPQWGGGPRNYYITVLAYSCCGNPAKATVLFLCDSLTDWGWLRFSSEWKFVSSSDFLKGTVTVLSKQKNSGTITGFWIDEGVVMFAFEGVCFF